MTSTQQPDAARLMRLATYASVSVATILIVAKLVAWFITDSISILATLIDSSLDVLASLLNLVAVHHALQPADREHSFGHGKAEALAGMGQAMFIAGSAGLLLLQAVGRIFHPQAVSAGLEVGVSVMVFSMVATMLLILFQKYVIRHTNSTAIKADALHYKTDLLVNGSVIVALLLTFYGWSHFDAIFGIGIAIFILYSAWDIVRESIDLLMDHELPDEVREKIKTILSNHPEAHGFHDLRTRRSGTTVFIQLHLELDASLRLSEAHRIADQVERELESLFADAEVIIHEDPVIV
ncbi:MAG: cation diffusion facilitator family transporter [Gammaproteobacteria bacterium]|nr:cation diffusion facilitator family transporter [Gammaproteobacteria bacterium]MDH5591727.1 cation diffusion facilitator family transporter [Gammaproteobacteria bacterium]